MIVIVCAVDVVSPYGLLSKFRLDGLAEIGLSLEIMVRVATLLSAAL